MGKENHCKVSTLLYCLKKYNLTKKKSSPDAVSLTKQGLLLALERPSMTDATYEWLGTPEAGAWKSGDNLTEGLMAFAMKRKAVWVNPHKL